MDWKLIGEGIGVVAIIVSFFVFLSNRRKTILICKGITDVLWCANNFMIGATTGAILNIVMVFREFVFYNRLDKKWAQHKFWMVIFSVMCFVSPVVEIINTKTFNILPFFPAVGSVIAVFGFYNAKPSRIRAYNFLASTPWLIYTIMVGNITCAISTAIGMISAILGEIGARRAAKNESKTEN